MIEGEPTLWGVVSNFAFGKSWTQTFLGWLGHHSLLANGRRLTSVAIRVPTNGGEPLANVASRRVGDERDGEDDSQASGPLGSMEKNYAVVAGDESMMTNDRLATCLSFTARIEAISPRARQYELREN
jgi:hypothetical protein